MACTERTVQIPAAPRTAKLTPPLRKSFSAVRRRMSGVGFDGFVTLRFLVFRAMCAPVKWPNPKSTADHLAFTLMSVAAMAGAVFRKRCVEQ